MAYELRHLPLEALLGPVAQATERIARLDERLVRSPVRDGWVERMHFRDAVSALWVEGELVHLEDLVFRDANMDQRTPTHELARAHAVLRTRRRIVARPSDWALSDSGLRELTGQADEKAGQSENDREGQGDNAPAFADDASSSTPPDDPLAEQFAEIDAVLARSTAILDGDAGSATAPRPGRKHDGPLALLYDGEWDEAARLDAWREALAQSRHLPVVLRTALAIDAWQEIDVLERGGWVGPLLAAALLRQEGVSAGYLPCLHLGAKNVQRERRRSRNRSDRILAWIDAMSEAATIGLKEHDRLMLAKERMERTLRGRRSNSKLPKLIDLVLARPVVSTSMVQHELKVSRQGALDLIAALNLREMTGRGSYRAWGLL